MKHTFAFLILAGLTGCGGAEVTRVTGSVRAQGESVQDVCATFWPKIDLHLGMIYAEATDPDGAFAIRPDADWGEGRAGTYKVFITDNRIQGFQAAFDPSAFKRVARKYWDHKTTPLEVRLERGVNELDPFEIERGETTKSNLMR